MTEGVSGPQQPEEKLCVLRFMSRSRNSFRTWLEPRVCTSGGTLPGECLSSESWCDLPGHAPAPAFTKRKEAGKKNSAPRDAAP